MFTPEGRSCATCGAELAAFAIDGFCPGCLLERGLSSHRRDTVPPLSRVGDYELIEEIARGGMGVVYKARQMNLGRIVAVKMILSGQFASAAEMQRFRTEARATAALQHPGIVAIHQVGEHDGLLYFSMDFVEGRNLAQLVRDGPWPACLAAECARDVAQAIHYAHQHGVLHRDLKPSNVLIDADGRPRVTDFGLAKRLTDVDTKAEGAELTVSGQVLGSPNFMPPEQAAGKHRELTPASDVYSLGALLYHMLTGRPPFLADDIAATLRLVCETEPIAPTLLASTLPRDLETICLKCLEKNPLHRYATAQDLVDELGRYLRNEPISARPIGPVGRLWRWSQRHPATAMLSILLILVLFVGASVVLTQWRKAEETDDLIGIILAEMALGIRKIEFPHQIGSFSLEPVWPNTIGQDKELRTNQNGAQIYHRPSGAALGALLDLSAPLRLSYFSSDDSKLFTLSDDKYVRVWDANSGRLLGTFPHAGTVIYAQFSPDGKRLVTLSESETFRSWTIAGIEGRVEIARAGEAEWRIAQSNQVLLAGDRVRTRERSRVTLLEADDIGRAALTELSSVKIVGPTVVALIWDLSSGSTLTTPMASERGSIARVRFSSDGKNVVTIDEWGTILLWDGQTGKAKGRYTPTRRPELQRPELQGQGVQIRG